MRKRICFFLGTEADRGGAGRILLNVIRLLDLSRFEPLVMVSARGPISEEMEVRGVDCRVWPRRDAGNPVAHFTHVMCSAYFLWREGIDLVHMNYGCLGWRPGELPAARLVGVPLVTHFQRIMSHVSPYMRYSTCAVTCSSFVAAASRIGAIPTHVVYDAVCLERFSSGRKIHAELGLHPDHKVVSFIGRARRSKGLDVFVALAELIPGENVRFLISTQRGGKMSDAFSEAEIASLVSRDPRIHCIGYRKDVENVYATSDVIVVPSQVDEPCPAVLLEAGAAHRVVVGTRTGSTPEIIVDGQNGFLVGKEDVFALAERVQQLIDDDSLRQRMEGRARELVVQRFTDAPIRSLESLYDELIGKNRRR